MNDRRDWVNELIQQCIGCGACAENCGILTEIDESPGLIASRGVSVDEAFACSLCGKCEAVCPLDLSPFRMFEQRRIEAVANGEMDVKEYRYLFPDLSVNVMTIFREHYGVDYTEFNQSSPADTGFFPGCTLMTYSPELTKKVYETLAESYKNPVLFTDCCGLPMFQIGLPGRGKQIQEQVKEKITRLGVKRLVIACPNCYYYLREALANTDVELVTVYEALKDHFVANHSCKKCTVHDSCPDRFEGIYGKQVRQALKSSGWEIVEMEHKGSSTICCGSSGQLSHFRPDLSEEIVQQRISEAEKSGSGIMVAYCHACVLNFGQISSAVSVKHVLNLLLGFDEDYAEVKNSAAEMFMGPDGAKNWEKLINQAFEE